MAAAASGAAAGAAAAAAAAAINQRRQQESDSQTSFWNPLETAKHHLISCQKWRKISRNNTLLGGRNVPSEILLEIKFWLLLLVAAAPAAAAAWCCCWWLLLLPAAAAAGGCCCWLCLAYTGCWLLGAAVLFPNALPLAQPGSADFSEG